MASSGYSSSDEESQLCDHLLKIRLSMDDEEEDLLEFVSPDVLAGTSTEVNVDMSNKYAKPIGTPPGSALNVSAPEFVPTGSTFSVTTLPPPVTTMSQTYGPFDRTYQYWSHPVMTSVTTPITFDEGYNKQVIDLPVRLPRLFNYDSVHESRVTVGKLRELYQVMYSFIDGGDQTIVPNTVKLPVFHNFTSYNEEYVTVATLQAMYRCLYNIEPDVKVPTTTSAASGDSGASTSAAKLETLDDLRKHIFTQGGRLKKDDKGRKCNPNKCLKAAYKSLKKLRTCIKKKILRKKEHFILRNLQGHFDGVKSKSESSEAIINSTFH